MDRQEALLNRLKELDVTGKLLSSEEKTRNTLQIACLFAELDDDMGYLDLNCYDISEFGLRYFHLSSTQVKTYMSVARAFAVKHFNVYVIENIDYLCRYSFTALDQIRLFPEFDGNNIHDIEKEHGITPWTTVAVLKAIRKGDNGLVEVNFKFRKEHYDALRKICRDENIGLYELLVYRTLERYYK